MAAGAGNGWQRQASRRMALRSGALAAAAGAGWLVAACSGAHKKSGGAATNNSTPVSAASLPRLTPRPTAAVDANSVPKDGILKSRQAAPFASINPYKGLDSGLLWGFTIYDHLWYTPADTGERVLFLAATLEQPDPLTINITIKPSLFHDKPPINGRAVTTSDIKASWTAAAAAPQISSSTWWTQSLDHLETPADKTFVIKLKQPDAWTYTSTNAGSPIASSILPAEIAAKPDLMDDAGGLIGSGRYQYAGGDSSGNFKLSRFEQWRVPGEPWLAGIQYFLIQEQAAAIAAFQSQQIYSLGTANKPEADGLVAKLGNQISIESNLTSSIWMVTGRADGPWADPRVRQAVNLALDRDAMIKLIAFGDAAKSGPIPPVFKTYTLDDGELATTLWKTDPAAAKQMLAAAGFDTSKQYTIKYYTPGDDAAQFAQIVQAQLQTNLGLKIQLVGQDFGTWLAKTAYGGDYDGFITYPTLAYDDPSSYLGNYQKQNGPRKNAAGFLDDELDGLVNAQKSILDDGQRQAAIKDIQRKAIAKAAPFFTTYTAVANTAWWNFVKGRTVGRGSFDIYDDHVYIEKS